MIKLKVEGSGEEIVGLILALRGAAPVAVAAHRVEEAAPAAAGGPYPPEPLQMDSALVQKGMQHLHGLVQAWAVNFGHDADPEAQPDRLKLLDDSMRHFNAMLAFIHYSQGLTRAVRTVAPQTWTKHLCRKLAENIASVSSATGIGELAAALEYTSEFTSHGAV